MRRDSFRRSRRALLRCADRSAVPRERRRRSARPPYTIEYYYKCQWAIKRVLRLFIRHYPLLKKIQSPAGFSPSRSSRRPTILRKSFAGYGSHRYKNSTVATTANPMKRPSSRTLAGPGD